MQREIDALMDATRATLQRVSSPRSRQLALDRLVDPVITRELRKAQRGLGQAYAQSCATRIESVLRELPPDCDIPVLAALFAPRGALGRLLQDGKRVILALLDLEWSMVPALVDAVCAEQGVHLGGEGPR
jgi:hypothetical protein